MEEQYMEQFTGNAAGNDTHRNIEETVIRIPGLVRPSVLLQITDSHLTATDDRASEYTKRMAEERTACFARYPDAGTHELFRRALDAAADAKADCLIMTGDILDFPSGANVEELKKLLDDYGREWFFVTGNHDWSRAWIDGREERRGDDLELLSAFLNPHTGYEVKEGNGVRLLGIDDSDYQITGEQLEFFREQTADGTPCLLFMHIPLFLPTLLADTLKIWRSPIMTGIPEDVYTDRTDAIHAPLPSETTKQFCRLAGRLENIYGIFAGHLHFSHTDVLESGRKQFVTAPGFEGGGRLIRLVT